MVQRVALFADIHSNYFALKACFEDALSNGADSFIFLGDYISDLCETRRTLDLIYQIRSNYKCYFLRGNRERYMLEHKNKIRDFCISSKTGALLYTYNQLDDADIRFFNSLKIYDKIKLSEHQFEIAHSLKNNDGYYFDDKDTYINNIFSEMETDYFLTAHAHKQYIKKYEEKTIINPGSVGVPRGHGGLAQYAILNVENSTINCKLYQIDYDLTSLIMQQFKSNMIDYAKYWAISILYDVITGEEYTMKLLHNVLCVAHEDVNLIYNENIWKLCATDLGIKFTEEEILDFYNRIRKP